MRRYLTFLLAHRFAVLAAIGIVSLLAGYNVTRGVIASSVIKLFFGENPEYLAYRELANEFGGNDVMVVAFEDEELLTPEGVARLSRIVDRVQAIEDIEAADSLLLASRIAVEGDDLVIEPHVDAIDTATAGEAVAAALRADPLVADVFYSTRAPATAVLVELTPDPSRPIEVVPKILDQVVDAFVQEGYARERLHLAGLVPESTEATVQASRTIFGIFPFTVVLLAGVVFLLFLRLWPVVITGGVALVSTLWTFGFAVLVDRDINLLMAMVPGMITVIAFSDIIHLYSAFVRELRNGLPQHEAVLKSGSEVGVACLFTSITTFVGFASIAFVPTPVLRQLGVVLGAGVAFALLLALTVVPIILSLLPLKTDRFAGESKRAGDLMDRLVRVCMRVSLGFPKATVFVFSLIIIACAYGLFGIEVEASFASRLSESNHIRVAQRFIEERFAAANFLDVYIIADEGDLLGPDRFQKIAELEGQVRAMPEVERVASLVDLIDVLHTKMSGSRGLPESRELLAQYLLLFEVSGGRLTRLVDEDRRIIRMTLRLDPDGMRANARIGKQVAAMGRALLDEGVRVKPTGISYLFGDWVGFILAGQRRGLIFAILTTCVMMVIGLRSIRVGVLSMIPNLLPLLALGGYVGLAWDKVDSDTMLIATFAIGIAVDDTIHFLTRLRFESRRTTNPRLALERTFFFTGRAIIQTTVILCLGLSPFAASDYFSTRIVGTLMPMTLLVALFADLLLVPALSELGILRFKGD